MNKVLREVRRRKVEHLRVGHEADVAEEGEVSEDLKGGGPRVMGLKGRNCEGGEVDHPFDQLKKVGTLCAMR